LYHGYKCETNYLSVRNHLSNVKSMHYFRRSISFFYQCKVEQLTLIIHNYSLISTVSFVCSTSEKRFPPMHQFDGYEEKQLHAWYKLCTFRERILCTFRFLKKYCNLTFCKTFVYIWLITTHQQSNWFLHDPQDSRRSSFVSRVYCVRVVTSEYLW